MYDIKHREEHGRSPKMKHVKSVTEVQFRAVKRTERNQENVKEDCVDLYLEEHYVYEEGLVRTQAHSARIPAAIILKLAEQLK